MREPCSVGEREELGEEAKPWAEEKLQFSLHYLAGHGNGKEEG